MSKVTAIIKRRNLLRKCKEKHTTYVNIDVILMWLDNIKEELEEMCKINVKKSLLEVVEYYNLEILKIDLMNDEESSARFYNEERDVFSCKVYTTLEDFELESIFMYDKVRGMVYCRDTKEPVWIVVMKEVLGGEFQTFIKINLKS